MNTRTKMPVYHVKCVETVYFTVKVEAESEKQAEDLALDDINSHELVSEATTDWDIEEIILESEEVQQMNSTKLTPPISQTDFIL